MKKHWTAQSNEDFRFSVAFDFVSQLEDFLLRTNMSRRDLAKTLEVSPGRVSQVLNDPGNLTLRLMVDWARKIGQKVAVVLYDDGDSAGVRGPIAADVFRSCWVRSGKPDNQWEIQELAEISAGTAQYDPPCNVVQIAEWRKDPLRSAGKANTLNEIHASETSLVG